jgi:hypothetical protein
MALIRRDLGSEEQYIDKKLGRTTMVGCVGKR